MTEAFSSKVLKGLTWSTVGNAFTQFANIAVFVILGRYFLAPSEFGLVAMITVLTGLASTFTEFGLGAALVQKQDADESHRSSVFWLSVALGFMVYALFVFLAPVIANFYDHSILQPMTMWLSITFVLGTIVSVPRTLLQKELKFRAIAVATVIATTVSGIISIALAALSWGPWSLVAKAVVHQAIFCLAIWLSSTWRPKIIFDMAALQGLLSFGVSFLSTRLFSYSAMKVDEFSIGKFVGEAGLGLYSNAFRIVQTPISLIKNQIVGVFFPAFSSIQGDKPRTKKIALQLSGTLAMIGFPALFFLVVASRTLIQVLLDDRWLEMDRMMVMLSLIAMLEVSIFPGVLFLSQGCANGYFRLMLCTKSLSSLGIVVGVLMGGIDGLLVGMLVAALVSFFPYIHFSGRVIDMRVSEQLKVNVGPFLISASSALAVFLLETMVFQQSNPLLALTLKAVLYFGFVASLYQILRPYPLDQILTMLLRKRPLISEAQT